MRAIITGGGTGGHIYPAIAIADEIKRQEPDSEILYIGTEIGLEKDIVPRSGYDMKFVSAMWIDRSNPIKIIKTGSATLKGIQQSLKIMKEFKPDVVIGTGGYVCFPVLFAGHRYGARCYIHEQNAFPGMANRSLERFVNKVFLGFPEASEYFKSPEKHLVVGNPVRDSFFHVNREEARAKLGISENQFVIFSFGGSQGAERINQVMLYVLEHVNRRSDITLFFGTGSQYYDEILTTLEEKGIDIADNIHIESYIDDMPSYLGAADIVIGRSGALSVAEICTSGSASILIPSPNVTGNHQYFNAKSVADKEGAILIEEKDLTEEGLWDIIENLSQDPERVQAMQAASVECVPRNTATLIYDELRGEVPVDAGEGDSEEEDSAEDVDAPVEESLTEENTTEDVLTEADATGDEPAEESSDEALEDEALGADDDYEPSESEAFVEETDNSGAPEDYDVSEAFEELDDPGEPEEPEELTAEGIAFREIPREKRIRRKAHHLRNFLIVVGCILAVAVFLCSPIFNLKTVEVEGNNYYSDEEIINMSGVTLGENLFRHSQKKEIRASLEKDPYFAEIQITRKLPSTLRITVTEREQVAAVVYGNRYVVIDMDGRVLRITDVDPKITIISGLTLSKIKSGKEIKAEESSTLEDTLDMIQTMKNGDLFFKKIEVSKIHLKAYIYDSLSVVGKAEDMKEVIENGSLQKVVQKLYKNKTKRGTISVGQENYISFSPAY